MVDRNAGSIVDMIFQSMDSVPSLISGNIPNMVDLARIRVQNYTGASIPQSGTIPEKYVPVIYELARATGLAQMAGVGADFNYSLGELSVSKGAGDANLSTLEAAVNSANQELHALGRKNHFRVTV